MLNIFLETDSGLNVFFSKRQRRYSKNKLIRIENFPHVKADLLPKYSQRTLNNWESSPYPPPEVVNFLEYFSFSCVPVKIKKKELDDGSFVDVVLYDKKQ